MKSRLPSGALVVILLLIGLPSRAAAEGILYGSDAGGALLTIDTADGSSAVVGNMGVIGLGIAYSDTTGLMYTRDFNLYTVDPETAAATLVGASGFGITGLAFDTTFSTLYAVGQIDGGLYTVDTVSGAVTLVGLMGIISPLGVAVEPDGTLWVANVAGEIFTVDPGTGAASLVSAIEPGGLTSIAFDRVGNFYGITLDDDMLVLLDSVAETSTDVGGPVVGTDVRGLGVGPLPLVRAAIPASGPLATTVLIVLLGLSGAWLAGRLGVAGSAG